MLNLAAGITGSVLGRISPEMQAVGSIDSVLGESGLVAGGLFPYPQMLGDQISDKLQSCVAERIRAWPIDDAKRGICLPVSPQKRIDSLEQARMWARPPRKRSNLWGRVGIAASVSESCLESVGAEFY